MLTQKEVKRAAYLFKITKSRDEKALRAHIEEMLVHLSNNEFIHALYYILLYREPDPDGLRSYVRALECGVSRTDILKNIKSSEEYKIKVDNVPLLDESSSDWYLASGNHERQLINIFKTPQSTSLFIDIGAHVGTWTLQLAPFFGGIIAFEPNPLACQSLRRNLELNQISNVRVEEIALWSTPVGKMNLVLYCAPAQSTLLPAHPIDNKTNKIGEIQVVTTSLDAYLDVYLRDIKAPKIKLIKIDVEGAELEVVKGAVNTIERHKPSLVIELHLPQNEKPIKEILKSIGIKVSEYIWQAQKHLLYVAT